MAKFALFLTWAFLGALVCPFVVYFAMGGFAFAGPQGAMGAMLLLVSSVVGALLSGGACALFLLTVRPTPWRRRTFPLSVTW